MPTEPENLVLDLPWRVGAKLGRTIYAQFGDAASDSDLLIGVMDTAAFAVHLVKLHNEGLAGVREPLRTPQ